MRVFVKSILLAVLLLTVCKVFEPLVSRAAERAPEYAMTLPDGSEMPTQEDDVQEDDDVACSDLAYLFTPAIQKITAPDLPVKITEPVGEIVAPPPQA